MPVNDELGTRMKGFYEVPARTYLTRKVPVALRIDGKAFHTFTRGLRRPFDAVLMASMQETMKYLCQNIQGCVFGYTQSDEITLILIDYQNIDTDAWFGYQVQKMCSVGASMATLAFNKFFMQEAAKAINNMGPDSGYSMDEMESYVTALKKCVETGAMFDCRCFNIPKDEVTNLIYWRQLDATRNSIQMVGQANFSHNELQGKNCAKIQDMLMLEKGINWNTYSAAQKRGTACFKVLKSEKVEETPPMGGFGATSTRVVTRSEWYIDRAMPILKGEERNYVDKWIYVGEDPVSTAPFNF